MREIIGVAEEPRTRRRWFHDEFFDLFVWQTAGGEITLFQLCYGIASSERALVWHKYGGFFHDGAEAPSKDSVLGAQLAPGGPVTADPIIERFYAATNALPDDIREPLIARLQEYAEKKPQIPTRRKQFRREDWQQAEPARDRASKQGKQGKQQA
jgi:hypothetical protein